MRIALSTILFCLLMIYASANEKVHIGASPSWLYNTHPNLDKKPASRDISDGYYFEWLDFQTNLLTSTEYTHFIKHVINESGVQNAGEISVTFAPQFQQVIFHHIAILRDGTVINQLKTGQIKVVQEETDAANFEYNGLKRAFLTLKDVRKGDRIEVSYSVVGFNPVFGKKFSDEFYFSNSTAVCNYTKTIITQPDRRLLIRTINNAPAPTEQQQGNTLVYHWDNPPLKNWESDAPTPSWYNDYPTVYVTEYTGWKEVVGWGLSTFNNYKYTLPAGLQQKIAGWKRLAKNDQDLFANLATRFVQNDIRYLGLEIGRNTHQPHPPADVYTHRFGDCKDKALLLSAILQREGIPAYVALISTTLRDKLTTIAPSPASFDHAIVAIERSKGVYIYVDPTISGQRGELINLYVPAYGFSLILRDGEDRLQPVEPGFEYNSSITENLEVRYYDTSRFTVTSVYAGGAADKVRDAFEETSVKELEENYRKYYASLFEDIRMDGPIASTDDSLKNELTVNERYAIPQIWNTDRKGKKSFDFRAMILHEYLPDPTAAAAGEPLAVGYPRSIDYTLNISMPETWHFNSGELHIKNGSYQFDFIPHVMGSSINLSYTVKTFKDNIPAEELAQYKSDYKNISERISFELYKGVVNETAPEESSPSTAPDRSPLTPARTLPNGRVCWPAIWLTFFFSLFFTWLFRHLNARSEETLYAPGSGYPLGGWAVLLGIGIGLTFLIRLIGFIRINYFSYEKWTLIGNAGRAPLQFIYLAEMTIGLCGIASAAAVGYWFIRRRDIFPRMFTWYAGVLVAGRLLLLVANGLLPAALSPAGIRTDLVLEFLRTCLYVTICLIYVIRSEQVKGTFLEAYRPLT